MKKGAVEPWIPADRWNTPPRNKVKDSPATEWCLWIAHTVAQSRAKAGLNISRQKVRSTTRTAKPCSMAYESVWIKQSDERRSIPFARDHGRAYVCPRHPRPGRLFKVFEKQRHKSSLNSTDPKCCHHGKWARYVPHLPKEGFHRWLWLPRYLLQGKESL